MVEVIAVGLAGALGAVARYGLGAALTEWNGAGFPAATFICNVAGSFLLGYLYGRMRKSDWLPPIVFQALGTGFVGSFTTFSAFSYETVALLQNGRPVMAFMYIGLSVLAGLSFCWLVARTGYAGFRTIGEGEGA